MKRDTNNIHANTLDQDILPCCIHLTEGQWPFQSHWPCTTSITHDLYRLWINFITVKWYQTLQNKWFNVFPNFFRLNIFLFDSLGTNFWSPGHSTSCGCRLLLCSQLLSLKCPTWDLMWPGFLQSRHFTDVWKPSPDFDLILEGFLASWPEEPDWVFPS